MQMGSSKLSEAEWLSIKNAYESGAMVKNLAAQYGVHTHTIYVNLKARGAAIRKRGFYRGERSDRSKAIIAYIQEHPQETLQSIGDRFGVTKQWVGQLERLYRERSRMTCIKERNSRLFGSLLEISTESGLSLGQIGHFIKAHVAGREYVQRKHKTVEVC